MSKPVISSLSNPLVKRVRALRQRKARAETDLFLVEGLHHVGEALNAGWDVDAVLHTPGIRASEFGNTLITMHPDILQPVSQEVMESLADKENPQGILAVVHQRHNSLAQLPSLRCALAVVSPQDPGNVGTILRTMDAVDVDALVLVDGGVDPYHPTSVRASMGAIFWKSLVQASFEDFMAWSQRGGYQRIGTSAHAQLDYRQLTPAEPWVLLLGSEQKGLSPEHLAACDVAVSLPMRGHASSLNLAVAAGVLLYHFCA